MISCGYFPKCSGCELQKGVDSPPIYKEIKDFFSPVFVPLIKDKIIKWRLRTKLAVRGTSENPRIGLFKRGTHEVVPIPHCPLHHPMINMLVKVVENLLITHKISPYEEGSHVGILRYLQCVVERKTQRIQLTLILNAKSVPFNMIPFLEELKQSPLLHSLWLNFQPIQDNRIIGPTWQHYCGNETVEEDIVGKTYFFHPACFSQAHLDLFEEIIRSIQNKIIPNKKVVEFYAGVGVIGLGIVETAASLICSEINPFAKDCFEKQASLLPADLRNKIDFQSDASENLMTLLDQAEIAIVDPPRKGLSYEFCGSLIASPKIEQCIYISCGFDSLKRDAARFLAAGWKITTAEAYLLFPGTNHLEILTIFQKKIS